MQKEILYNVSTMKNIVNTNKNKINKEHHSIDWKTLDAYIFIDIRVQEELPLYWIKYLWSI